MSLKEQTKDKHTEAERTPFMHATIKGKIPKEELLPEQIWNEEKMEGIKKLIQKQKLIEINQIRSAFQEEFPDHHRGQNKLFLQQLHEVL
jgi:hypothetical protein